MPSLLRTLLSLSLSLSLSQSHSLSTQMIPVSLLVHLTGSKPGVTEVDEEPVSPVTPQDFITRLGARHLHPRLVDDASNNNWIFCIPDASTLRSVAVTTDFLGIIGVMRRRYRRSSSRLTAYPSIHPSIDCMRQSHSDTRAHFAYRCAIICNIEWQTSRYCS